MDDRELKKWIQAQSENIEIPASLEPENVVKQLEKKVKKKKTAYHRKVIGTAACLVVVVGIGAAGIAGVFGSRGNEGTGIQQAEERMGEAVAGKVAAIATAEDYDEVYSYIEAENKRRDQGNSWLRSGGESAAKTESVADASGSTNGASMQYADSGYSDTNIRQEGVGEGDRVKTDGERIYVVDNHSINIVDITQEQMQELSKINFSEEQYISELFVKNDRLIVFYNQTEVSEVEDKETIAADMDVKSVDGAYYREYTVAETFDISNPEEPKSVGKVSQSGSFHTMRAVGDYVYLFSNYYPEMDSSRTYVEGYIPKVQGEALQSTDILLPSWKTGSQYTVITAFSMQDPENQIDSKAVFGASELCYVSESHIYICETNYGYEDADTNQTCIRKIAYEDGTLNAVGQVKIEGVLNDTFSIDEYEGNLRLVTTITHNKSGGVFPIAWLRNETKEAEEAEKDSNTLYILDENLEELSRIEGLAEEEQVYSARFVGNTGYFVTFRQTDPLFSVDLSDPNKPKILGELKIPGFSEYLHPYGEGQLLGIGMDVDESGTVTNGVKLSMFDISDPADVKEFQKYVLKGTYSTDVAYNYKAAFVDVEKNMIGFTVYGETAKYDIFSYDKENGFTLIFERELTGMFSDVRAFYVGERLYLVAGNTVESYHLDTFEKIDDLVL